MKQLGADAVRAIKLVLSIAAIALVSGAIAVQRTQPWAQPLVIVGITMVACIVVLRRLPGSIKYLGSIGLAIAGIAIVLQWVLSLPTFFRWCIVAAVVAALVWGAVRLWHEIF